MPAKFSRLATAAIIAVNVLGIFALAKGALGNDSWDFDQAILLAMRSASDLTEPIGGHRVEKFFHNITDLGSSNILILVALTMLGYLLLVGRPADVLLALVTIVGGYTLDVVLKQAFARPRPDVVSHLVDAHSYSFPSGHAMFATVTYITLALILARMQPGWRLSAYIVLAAVLLTLLIGISRLYLGVHWPTDVIAGWLFGASWIAVCFLIGSRIQRSGLAEA